jgi:hypothetical protein
MPVSRREWHETETGIPFTYPPTEKGRTKVPISFLDLSVVALIASAGARYVLTLIYYLGKQKKCKRVDQKMFLALVKGITRRRLPKWSEGSREGEIPRASAFVTQAQTTRDSRLSQLDLAAWRVQRFLVNLAGP